MALATVMSLTRAGVISKKVGTPALGS